MGVKEMTSQGIACPNTLLVLPDARLPLRLL